MSLINEENLNDLIMEEEPNDMLKNKYYRLRFTRKVLPLLNVSYESQSIYQGTSQQRSVDYSSTQIKKLTSSHG